MALVRSPVGEPGRQRRFQQPGSEQSCNAENTGIALVKWEVARGEPLDRDLPMRPWYMVTQGGALGQEVFSQNRRAASAHFIQMYKQMQFDLTPRVGKAGS